MDTIKLNPNIFEDEPLFRGFESKIYLYGNELIKFFYNKSMENKVKKLKILENLDEDIIKPKAIVLDKNSKIIGYTMEYKNNFRSINPRELSHQKKIKYLLQLKEKLDILHKHDIVYGDIKSSNILINDNFEMYLCDLDNIQIDNLPIDVINIGAYLYTDVINNIDKSLDIYMYNIYVLKILLGFHTIDEEILKYLYDSYYKRWRYDNDFREIIYNMMNLSEETKESIKTLIKMP